MAQSDWIEHRVEEGAAVLYLAGAWRLVHLAAIAEALAALRLRREPRFVLDGSRLAELDTAAGFTLFRYLAELGCTESTVSVRGFDPRHRRLLALVHERMASPPARSQSLHLGVVQRIGAAALALAQLLRTHNAFLGQVAVEALAVLRTPKRFRVRETVSQF